MEAQPEITHNISSLKHPMLKIRVYDLWSMRMEQYLTHTYYALWEVIINDDSPVPEPLVVETVVPLKIEAQKLARKNELKAKTIKIRFGGNKESMKMHKTILMQQYDNFVASRSEGLDKTIDRFQKHISQLKLNGEVISQKDINMKLLMSLPSAWNNISLIMRNKPDIKTLSMDELYNNLKVYEAKIKGQSILGSNSHNVAFVSSINTSSINETVNVAHDIPAASLKEQPSASSYANDVAMIIIRVKKFIKRIERNLKFNGKEPVGFDKTKVECYNWHKRGHFARECHAPRNLGNRSVDNERRVVPAMIVKGENEMPKCEILETASDSSASEIDEDNNQAKDRYKVGIGYHAVLSPYTRNYMPQGADLSFARLDEFVFKFKISETRTSVNVNESIASKSSEEIREEPNTVRLSAHIIED
uniref:Uncharacterized protein n=1 Tax=Tanacetum cinerariifolium TaxID=118510 RepID=A0A6L2JWV7_TANCI|nr:hypothetical protein [Tanacetum cinerariifolium]